MKKNIAIIIYREMQAFAYAVQVELKATRRCPHLDHQQAFRHQGSMDPLVVGHP